MMQGAGLGAASDVDPSPHPLTPASLFCLALSSQNLQNMKESEQVHEPISRDDSMFESSNSMDIPEEREAKTAVQRTINRWIKR